MASVAWWPEPTQKKGAKTAGAVLWRAAWPAPLPWCPLQQKQWRHVGVEAGTNGGTRPMHTAHAHDASQQAV
ncbi:hypothetical protein NDU88_007445 [Pleurodeles waltl]|uniref:Uncharacterized protein n=1 Tax=Pleurodeles waltl TaxID=8319 RepID=A0AAV7PML3_PLEWA|nr:hypothetical protein NDU88_007445 [Pleurodeles waltl]